MARRAPTVLSTLAVIGGLAALVAAIALMPPLRVRVQVELGQGALHDGLALQGSLVDERLRDEDAA